MHNGAGQADPVTEISFLPGGSDAGAALVDSLLPRPARFSRWALLARFRVARTSAVTLCRSAQFPRSDPVETLRREHLV
jgi:hypothetical protein